MSVSFASHAKPTVKRRRGVTRKTFTATLTGDLLEPRRGAWTRTIDKAGDVVEDGQDTRALLVVNRGDQLFLFGQKLEQIAIVEVVGVEHEGWAYRVATRFAIEAVESGTVFVMRRRT